MNDIYQTLERLQIVLPAPTVAAASYVPWVLTGSLLHLSGHLARRDGHVIAGRLGLTLDTHEGQAAARLVAIDLLGTLHVAAGGLQRIRRIVKLTSFVNSTPDFTEQHLVTNGASDLLTQVLGDAGRHARSAFGVAQAPLGACLEIELIAELA
jgi:enamine deaminase RidA (YjgF/YER057c/UK114 family)